MLVLLASVLYSVMLLDMSEFVTAWLLLYGSNVNFCWMRYGGLWQTILFLYNCVVKCIFAYSLLHDALQKAGMSALFRECSFSLSYVGLKVDNIYDRVSNASRNLF